MLRQSPQNNQLPRKRKRPNQKLDRRSSKQKERRSSSRPSKNARLGDDLSQLIMSKISQKKKQANDAMLKATEDMLDKGQRMGPMEIMDEQEENTLVNAFNPETTINTPFNREFANEPTEFEAAVLNPHATRDEMDQIVQQAREQRQKVADMHEDNQTFIKDLQMKASKGRQVVERSAEDFLQLCKDFIEQEGQTQKQEEAPKQPPKQSSMLVMLDDLEEREEEKKSLLPEIQIFELHKDSSNELKQFVGLIKQIISQKSRKKKSRLDMLPLRKLLNLGSCQHIIQRINTNQVFRLSMFVVLDGLLQNEHAIVAELAELNEHLVYDDDCSLLPIFDGLDQLFQKQTDFEEIDMYQAINMNVGDEIPEGELEKESNQSEIPEEIKFNSDTIKKYLLSPLLLHRLSKYIYSNHQLVDLIQQNMFLIKSPLLPVSTPVLTYPSLPTILFNGSAISQSQLSIFQLLLTIIRHLPTLLHITLDIEQEIFNGHIRDAELVEDSAILSYCLDEQNWQSEGDLQLVSVKFPRLVE